MMNFTQATLKKQIFLLFALLLMAGSTVLNAQSHTLRITSPASLAGDYLVQVAAFGPQRCDFDMIQGALTVGTDTSGSSLACGTIPADLTGKIVIVDRGTCNFTAKAINAQAKGAAAVIIVNNNVGANTGALYTPGGTSNAVTVPTFGMSLPDGNTLKAAIAAGTVQGTIGNFFVSNDIVVWGDTPGEGDFDGGLQGWASINNSCFASEADTFETWKWVEEGFAGGGAYGTGTISSPTSCNGAIAFESDFYDNNGTQGNFGGGPCAAPQFGELISPNIDVSASDAEGFSLKFYQTTRQFDSGYFVSWSIDGGATWIDTVAINTELETNADPTNNVVRVALQGTGGADSLRVKFIYDANYYYWIIDDVQIIEQESYNLSVNDFFAVSPNAATPLAHVEPIYFLADVGNRGALAQNNVNLNVSVEYRAAAGQPFTEVFSATLPYGNIPGNSTVENRVFPQTYTPTAVGTYIVTYSVSSDQADFDSTNNIQQYPFFITQNLFSKDYSTEEATATLPAAASWGDNESHSWAWGVHYYVPDAADNYIQAITFGIEPQDAGSTGQDIVIAVYKWTDTNGDELANPTERELVGLTSYTIQGDEVGDDLITVPFPFEGDDPVQLEDNTNYLVMVEYLAADQSDVAISFKSDLDYSATATVLGDSTGVRRYAGIIAVGGDLSNEDYAPSGFSGSAFTNIPVVRMQVGATPSSAKDLSKLESEFAIFPNPTSEEINLQLNLNKQAQTATVRLFDVSGKLMNQWSYDNVQKERYQYKVNNLSSGTYFLQVITEEGAGTKKFNVNK